MTVTFREGSAWFDGATGLTADKVLTIPSTQAVGDLILVLATWKDFAITAQITGTGWNEITEFAGGAVSTGNGVGSMKVAAWYKIATADPETNPTLDFSTTTGLLGEACVLVFSQSAGTWQTPTFATQTWPASAGPASRSSSTTVDIPAGGAVANIIGIRNDQAIFTRNPSSTQGIDATGGTVGTWTASYVEVPATHASTTTGNDMAADAGYRLKDTAATGTNLTVNVQISTADSGTILWVVLGDQAAGTTATPTTAALTLSTGTPTVTAPFTGQPTAAALALSVGTPTVTDNAYSAAVMADGPVAYYRMGEPSGSVIDSIPGGTAGSTVGTVTRDVTGGIAVGDDGAIEFNGSSGGVSVADQTKLDLGNGPFSIECWVNLDALPSCAFVSKSAGGGYQVGIDGSVDKLITVKTGTEVSYTGSTVLATGTWYHVVWVKVDPGTGEQHLYLNGVDETLSGSGSSYVNTTGPLLIGHSEFGDWLDGKLDEVAIYNIALGGARALAHYNAGSGAGPVTVTPTTASLTLTVGTPTVMAPALSQPTAVTLTLSRGTPTVTAIGTASSQPTTAALTLSVGTPTVVAVGTASRQPTAAGLTLGTATPTVATPVLSQPTASTLTISAGTPTVAVGAIVSAQPTAVALTLSVGTPTVVAVGTAVCQPTAAALTLTRGTPVVAAPALSQPTAAGLTLSAATPAVLAPRLSQPTAAALVLAVSTPTIRTPVLSQPTAVTLTLTAGTPAVAAVGTASRQPTAAALTLTGATPTVAAGGAISSQPTVATLTLATGTPTVSTGAAVSSQPTAAALTLSRGTPTVAAPALSLPTAVALTLSRGTPVVTAIGTAVRLPTAVTLTLSTATPPVAAPRVSQPTATVLSLGAGTPTVAATQNRLVLPSYAELTLTGHVPAVVFSGHQVLEPLPAALVLTGHAPSVEIHSDTPLPDLIYGFAIVATGDSGRVGSAQGGATVRMSEGGSTAVSMTGPSARVTIR